MILLFLVCAFVSEIIGTLVGFGSSTIFLPLALLLVDFKTALVLVAFLHIFGNIGRITFFKHAINRNIFFAFGLPSIIFTVLGAYLVHYASQGLLKFLLGIFILFYSASSLLKRELRLPHIQSIMIIGGSLSGFFAGLIGTGGALRGAFFNALGLEKNNYIATSALIALVVDISRIQVYFMNNFLEPRYYWYIPFLFIVALSGSYLGKQIIVKVPQALFKKYVCIALFLVGFKFTLEGITHFLQ